MPRPYGSTATPTYRSHRPSGPAVVTIEQRDFYLGAYGTKASKAEYDRLVGQAIKWACDQAFPPPDHMSRQRVDGEKGTRWESPKELQARLGQEKWEELLKWRQEHSWHSHQLRHNAATRLRKDYGLEVGQVVLGHMTLTVTQVYAEKNVAEAQRIMAAVG